MRISSFKGFSYSTKIHLFPRPLPRHFTSSVTVDIMAKPHQVKPQQQASQTKRSGFYRRPLPSSCIAFSSEEGRKIFVEAVTHPSGSMNTYYSLAEQFHTQSEPAYCGLGTLAMSLNALQIDPDRLWKGPWRWFSEELLDCCTPLDDVKTRGITFEEFVCLAKCNGAEAVSYRHDELTEDQFRAIVARVCSSGGGAQDNSCEDNPREILVANYSRATLGQTGSGHFSPVGGYHPERDMVLLFDVARFKYPPHWVSLSLLFQAMDGFDSETGKLRGAITLRARQRWLQPSLLQLVLRAASTTQSSPCSSRNSSGGDSSGSRKSSNNGRDCSGKCATSSCPSLCPCCGSCSCSDAPFKAQGFNTASRLDTCTDSPPPPPSAAAETGHASLRHPLRASQCGACNDSGTDPRALPVPEGHCAYCVNTPAAPSMIEATLTDNYSSILVPAPAPRGERSYVTAGVAAAAAAASTTVPLSSSSAGYAGSRPLTTVAVESELTGPCVGRVTLSLARLQQVVAQAAPKGPEEAIRALFRGIPVDVLGSLRMGRPEAYEHQLLLETLLTQLRATDLFGRVGGALKPLRSCTSASGSGGGGGDDESTRLLAMWLARPLADEMAALLVFVLQPIAFSNLSPALVAELRGLAAVDAQLPLLADSLTSVTEQITALVGWHCPWCMNGSCGTSECNKR